MLGFARPGLRFPIRRSRSNNVQTDSTLKVLRHGMRLCSAQISSCWSQMGSTHEVFVAVVVFSMWLSAVFLGSLLQVKKLVAVGQSCWSISFLHGVAQ